jgi:hypothetical protein
MRYRRVTSCLLHGNLSSFEHCRFSYDWSVNHDQLCIDRCAHSSCPVEACANTLWTVTLWTYQNMTLLTDSCQALDGGLLMSEVHASSPSCKIFTWTPVYSVWDSLTLFRLDPNHMVKMARIVHCWQCAHEVSLSLQVLTSTYALCDYILQ